MRDTAAEHVFVCVGLTVDGSRAILAAKSPRATATARRLSDLDEKQRLETDELRHPLLAYLRLHIQSKPQKHEPELLHSTQWETTLLAFSSVLPHCRRASVH